MQEEVQSRLKAKAACEHLVYRTQLQLLEGVIQEDVLQIAASVLQPQHYQDVVEERAASAVCGYPRCGNIVPGLGLGPSKYVSLSQHKVIAVAGIHAQTVPSRLSSKVSMSPQCTRTRTFV